jgi:hypothetical protein
MTLVRGLAVGISSRVVRWASPGCKEWAEGLEREAAVIENDWAALGWAIGSTRVLLDRRPAALTSLDEVPAIAQKLVEMARNPLLPAMQIMNGLMFLLWFFKARSTMERAGSAFCVLGAIGMGTLLLMYRRRSNVPWYDDIWDDPVACAHLYKEQVKRRDKLWIYGIPSLLCLMLGGSLFLCDVFFLWFLVPFFLLLPVILQVRRNNLRRIEEIDALLAERECGAEL